MADTLTIAGRTFTSRLFTGTAGYPNRQVMLDALTPLNLYARSKHAFDLWARDSGALDRPRLLAALRTYLKLQKLSADWESIEGAPDERLITSLAMICPFSCREKQALLESPCLSERARVLIGQRLVRAAAPAHTARNPARKEA